MIKLNRFNLLMALLTTVINVIGIAQVQAETDWVAYAQKELLNPRSDEKERLNAIGLLKVRPSNEQGAVVLGQVLVNDRSARVRKAAASALWGHDYTRVAEQELRQALNDEAEVSVRAAGALHAAGIPAREVAPGFRKGLNSSNRGTAFSAARGLVGVDSPDTLVPGLLAYLDWQLETPDNRGAWAAQDALEKLTAQGYDVQAYQQLTTYIDQQRDGAAFALRALMEMPNKPAGFSAWLNNLTNARNDSLRAAAVTALGRSGIKSAGTTISGQLLGAPAQVQLSAINACEQLRSAGAPCIQQLTTLLSGAADADIRAEAAEALHGILRDTETAPDGVWQAALLVARNDPDEDVRVFAISIVADMPVDSSEKLLALSEIAASEAVAFNQSRALARLAGMLGYPGQQVPDAVFLNVAPLTQHSDSEVARMAQLIIDRQ